MGKARSMEFFVVDDDPDMVAFQAAVLEAAGHVVFSNVAGAMALSDILARRPDCVLADLTMAELDGLELCRELRSRTELRGLGIVMVSGRRRDYWNTRAREAGADGYIVKPLDPETFLAQVYAIIDRPAG